MNAKESRAILALALLGSLAACATAISARNDPPDVAFTVAGRLNDTLGCVVSHMSETNSFGYPFRAVIVVPDQEYEVHPTREIMVGGEPIFVSVRNDPAGVRVQGYALGRISRNFDGLQEACG